MAQYIGYLQGNRGQVSRLGSKDSGIEVKGRGWRVGGSVEVYHIKETDKDLVRFSVDKGSSEAMSGKIFGYAEELENGKILLTLYNPLTQKQILRVELD